LAGGSFEVPPPVADDDEVVSASVLLPQPTARVPLKAASERAASEAETSEERSMGLSFWFKEMPTRAGAGATAADT
jgi:hypothetical protein